MASQTLEKTYHFNVIYNHAISYLAEGEDNVISLKFTRFLVDKLKTFGLKSGYYHDKDALPGKNIFSELFRVVDGSKWTIVIVSKGFSKNCWSKYSCQSAFKKLIDEDNGENLIPIGLGIDEDEFPDMHGIAQKAWFGITEQQWNSVIAAAEWDKIKRLVCPLDVRHHAQGGPNSAATLTAPKTVSTQNDSSIKAGFQDHDFTDISPVPADMPVSQQSQGTTGPRLSEPKLSVTEPLNTNLKKASSNIPHTEVRSNQTIQTKPVVVGSSNLANISKTEPSLPRTADGDDPPGSRSAEIINEPSYQLSSPMSLEPDCGLTMPEVTTQAQPFADDARLEQVNKATVPTIVESAETSATPTNDVDQENCNERQGESNGDFADLGYPESSLNQGSVDTANDAVSLTDEEQTGSEDETVFQTPPEKPNNQFNNDNPGETPSEEASDVAAGGDCPVVSQQLPLPQTANGRAHTCKAAGSPNLIREEPDGQEMHIVPNVHTIGQTLSSPSVSNLSEIMVKESTESSQPSGSSVLRPLLPRMVRLLLPWYLQPECAFNSIPTLD